MDRAPRARHTSHMTTETLTIQTPGTDDTDVLLYPEGGLVAIEITDGDGASVELRLSKTEAERLLAKLAVTIARLG